MLMVKEVLFQRVGDYWQRFRSYKFIVNAGAYVSGHVLQKAVAFLLIPVWARFLTPADYGITGTLAAYSGVLFTLLMMGLHGAVVRHYYDYMEDVEQQKRYITSVILFLILLPGLIIIGFNLWGPTLWARYTADAIPFDPYVRLMLWSTYVTLWLQVLLSLYEAQQKARQFVYIQYSRFLLEVVASLILVVALQQGAYGVLLSQLIAAIIVAVVVLRLTSQTWFTWQVKWKYISAALTFGLPLVPHAIAGWILEASDRIILEYFVPLSEIGLYNVGYTLGKIMLLLVVGINQAWVPYYYRLMQTDPQPEAKIIQVVSVYVGLMGGICLVGILFAGEIVHILMPPKYYGAVPYVAPVLIGYLMNGFYYFATVPLFYYNKTKLIPLLTTIAALFNILLNLWLIPFYGALAAAWVTMVANSLLFLLFFVASRRYHKIDYPLLRYSLAVLPILLSPIVTSQLTILNIWSLLAKTILMLIYIAIVYFTLIMPYLTKQLSFTLRQ